MIESILYFSCIYEDEDKDEKSSPYVLLGIRRLHELTDCDIVLRGFHQSIFLHRDYFKIFHLKVVIQVSDMHFYSVCQYIFYLYSRVRSHTKLVNFLFKTETTCSIQGWQKEQERKLEFIPLPVETAQKVAPVRHHNCDRSKSTHLQRLDIQLH